MELNYRKGMLVFVHNKVKFCNSACLCSPINRGWTAGYFLSAQPVGGDMYLWDVMTKRKKTSSEVRCDRYLKITVFSKLRDGLRFRTYSKNFGPICILVIFKNFFSLTFSIKSYSYKNLGMVNRLVLCHGPSVFHLHIEF